MENANEPGAPQPGASLKRGLAPSHPGVHLADALDGLKTEVGVSRTAVAERIGVGRRTLYDVIEGKSALSAELAVRLEALGLGSAQSWMGLQAAYDLWAARVALADQVAEIAPAWPVRRDEAAA